MPMTPIKDKLIRFFNIAMAFTVLTRTEWPYYFQNHLNLNILTSSLYCLPALLVLLFPSSMALVFLMFCGQIIDSVYNSPQLPNHWMLTFLTSIIVFFVFLKSRFNTSNFEDLFLKFKNQAHLGIATFYFFTAFWKMNHDFFDPKYSCTFGRFINSLGTYYDITRSTFLENAVIWGSVSIETLLPILLLFARTRVYAAFGLFAFHFILIVDKNSNYQNFSWTMIAHLTLVLAFTEKSKIIILIENKFLRIFLSLVSLLLIPLSFFDNTTWWDVRWAFSFLIFFGYLYLVLVSKPIPVKLQVAKYSIPAIVLAFFVFLNGIAPIIGIKNRSSWQMYSNIRLEANYSNHFLLPPSLDVFGFQKDTAEILETSDPFLKREYIDSKSKITWHDLRTYVVNHPRITLSWIHGNQEFETTAAGSDPRLPAPPWILQKLVWFRPIGENTAFQCAW
jgi:hypothetical protein